MLLDIVRALADVGLKVHEGAGVGLALVGGPGQDILWDLLQELMDPLVLRVVLDAEV